MLRAEADAKAQAARARGQAEAISTVFRAIHEGNPDQRLLAYQYMQMLPQIAQGDANKVWIVPSEISKALEGIGGFFSAASTRFAEPPGPAGSVGRIWVGRIWVGRVGGAGRGPVVRAGA